MDCCHRGGGGGGGGKEACAIFVTTVKDDGRGRMRDRTFVVTARDARRRNILNEPLADISPQSNAGLRGIEALSTQAFILKENLKFSVH